MKCYLAGPMRGIPEYNFPAFAAAAASLRARGYTVWNPAENDVHQDGFDPTKEGSHAPMRHYMKRDLPAVLDADFVVVLPGWENSQGARLEVTVAMACDIPVWDATTLATIHPENIVSASGYRARLFGSAGQFGSAIELTVQIDPKLPDDVIELREPISGRVLGKIINVGHE